MTYVTYVTSSLCHFVTLSLCLLYHFLCLALTHTHSLTLVVAFLYFLSMVSPQVDQPRVKRARRNALRPNSLEIDIIREIGVTYQLSQITVGDTSSEVEENNSSDREESTTNIDNNNYYNNNERLPLPLPLPPTQPTTTTTTTTTTIIITSAPVPVPGNYLLSYFNVI